ncbi:MAG: ATP-dependent Clp protease proteolytic subunit [Lachnospiraceae bacterium]|nr:ATP-dependent Clp protease proteolytic subunit [Lachnospiraceae bacterium]
MNHVLYNDSKSNNANNEQGNLDETYSNISEYGQLVLEHNNQNHKIQVLSIVGEIEGHECLPPQNKTTKYEHVLPILTKIEDDKSIQGILLLVNTVGGDVSSGLALAEMIASVSKPTVSLVIGDSHSIGVPLAVASDYSFIVPTGTMIIHPVRMGGSVLGAPQTFDYFKLIQERILSFIEQHSKAQKPRLEEMMLRSGILNKDLGTILVGKEAVEEGLIDEVGGLKETLRKLHELIDKGIVKQ